MRSAKGAQHTLDRERTPTREHGSGTGEHAYVHARVAGTELVALSECFEGAREALAAGTLYAYAARHPKARELAGRCPAYAVPLPDGARVVVRHNRHGGLFARITGDRFLAPTRAPYELDASRRLTALGVATPAVVGYAVYPAGPLLRRSDVMTREIDDARDLGALLTGALEGERRAALEAAAALVGQLSAVGARHHDLNVKNVLLARAAAPHTFTAYVLDVDRVEFERPGDSRVTEKNIERFARSARKWRELYGARIEESELARIAASVRRLVSSVRSPGSSSTRS